MRIGLALAGGGASGGAHVGVLRALLDAGISIDYISGTSSGAMVAGLFAAGLGTDDMLRLLPLLTRRQIDVDLSLFTRLFTRKRRGGVLRGNRLHAFIEKAVSGAHISSAHIPVAIVSTDLQTGRQVVFSSQPCPAPMVRILGEEPSLPLWDTEMDIDIATAIRASISIPFVFQPVHFGARVLADGGLVDNCPVAPLYALGADFVIAVDTITPFLRLRGRLPLRARAMMQQIVNIGLARDAALSAITCDAFLAPSVGPIGALDFPRLSSVAESGYAYTKERIPALLAAMRSPTHA